MIFVKAPILLQKTLISKGHMTAMKIKKKELKRHVLGEGFPAFYDGYRVALRDKGLHSIFLNFHTREFSCFCQKKCRCKPWRLVLERES